MKKTALVLGLIAADLLSCGKQDSLTRPRNFYAVSNTVNEKTLKNSLNQKPPVQLHKAGMSQMSFSNLQEILGNINIANYAIENNTQIVLIETLEYNVNAKGFNKMIDDFNLLYASDNELLMKSYQSYSDENCKKIYGCVGTVDDGDYDWKIVKFLPSPEKCTFEPTITISSASLYK